MSAHAVVLAAQACVELAAKGGKTRPFRMEPAYSGAPFDHPFFGRTIVDLRGLTAPSDGVPIYRQHDPTQFIGRSTSLENNGRKLDVKGFLFVGVSEADDVARISDQGGRWQASIKADPVLDAVDYVAADARVVVNGLELVGPIAVLRESLLREVSFTPRGVDATTSAVAMAVALAAPGGGAPSRGQAEVELAAAVDRDAARFVRRVVHHEGAGNAWNKAVALAAQEDAHAHAAYVAKANPPSEWPAILRRFAS